MKFVFILAYYSEGIPSEEALLSLYCELTGYSLPLPNWTFFLALVFFRVVINIQVSCHKHSQTSPGFLSRDYATLARLWREKKAKSIYLPKKTNKQSQQKKSELSNISDRHVLFDSKQRNETMETDTRRPTRAKLVKRDEVTEIHVSESPNHYCAGPNVTKLT